MFKQIFKGSLVVLGFKILGAISGFLLNLFISRWYGAEIYGVFSLLFTLILFLSIFGRLGLDLYVIRKIPELEQTTTGMLVSFISRSLQIVSIALVVIALLLLVLQEAIDNYLFKSYDASTYLYWLGLATAAYSFIFVLSSILRGFGELLRFSFFQHLYIPLCLLTAIAVSHTLIKVEVDVIFALYFTLLIGVILNAANVYTYVRSRLGSRPLSFLDETYREPIVRQSYPMIVTSSAIFTMAYLGQFFIGYFLSLREVGLYAAIMKLSLPLSFFSTAISAYIAPRITRAFLAKDRSKVKRIYATTIAILLISSTPVIIFYYFFPGFFLGLFGAEFQSGVDAFMIYSLAIYIGATLFGPIGYFLVMTDNQFAFQRIILTALALYIILSLILIPTQGIEGAATSTLIATLTWKLGGYVFLRWRKVL